jgi:hypothetical protein
MVSVDTRLNGWLALPSKGISDKDDTHMVALPLSLFLIFIGTRAGLRYHIISPGAPAPGIASEPSANDYARTSIWYSAPPLARSSYVNEGARIFGADNPVS